MFSVQKDDPQTWSSGWEEHLEERSKGILDLQESRGSQMNLLKLPEEGPNFTPPPPLEFVFPGFAKGWFPKGWFRRMFPRNENRNEATFAKTTLLETALLSPSDPFWC